MDPTQCYSIRIRIQRNIIRIWMESDAGPKVETQAETVKHKDIQYT